MFHALGSALHARRRLSLLLALAVAVLAAVLGGSVQTKVTNGLADYDDPTGSHTRARQVIQDATGIDPQQGYALLIRPGTAIDPDAPAPAAVRAGIDLLEDRSEVKRVVDYKSARDPGLVSEDSRSTVVVAAVRPMAEQDTKEAEKELTDAIEADPALRGHAHLGGPTIGMVQVGKVTTTDLALAEGLALPVLLVLLFLVFRGAVAALVPVIGAVFTLLLTMAGLRVATFFGNVSTGALNLAFALALGLAVDFGLLCVSRYRDELAVCGPGPEALRRTLATAGRTVLFSGLTVAAALAALLVFPQPYLRSMGLAGVITSLAAVLFALLGLPALLALLGSRINALAPRRLRRSEQADDPAVGRWRRIALGVMRRPVATALAATALLLLIASPALGIRFTGADASSLPTDISAGKVSAALETDFAQPSTSPLRIVAESRDQAPLASYAREIARVPGVERVAEPVRLDGEHFEIDAVLKGAPLDTAARDAATAVEDLGAPVPVRFTGQTADFLSQLDGIRDRLPRAAGVLALVTLVLLYAFTGSVVLPLKALVMNTLSTGAALGFLVWVFQDGHLGFGAQSGIESTTPLLVFALAFGLSTDYNVFLLGRIKEARATGLDDRAAVAEGLARTGRIVTSAALLFCVAVGALVFSRIVFVKELGLGTAFAVAVDATLVRALLVPALMTLLGKANWWAPGPLRRLHRVLRLDHAEPPAATPTTKTAQDGPYDGPHETAAGAREAAVHRTPETEPAPASGSASP
ncbi:MMPL family transporter [Streptomyces tubbatahanensis]|uniref:MMPL family transporter n=1 Tax=Streptomyces tubbatahanensis TaxID=2923272 RepID=A0ABY3XX78_9ACTN|nr:MMPL family transporter [Streptomyces tubbatahanensis]UNS99119.1 MMPL family transporter [Streptomyces tubbatahanensis]